MAVLKAGQVAAVLAKGATARVAADIPAKFGPGEPVVARRINPLGHTRLPRYARGCRGVVDRDHGVFIFPDAHAVDGDQKPQHCYSVCFTARELWGPEASPKDKIYIDLWDDHLDPADNK